MLRAELPLLLTLGLSWLFPRGSDFSCSPTWATLVWDVPPLEQKGTAQKEVTTPEVVFWSTSALCLLLLGCLLVRKGRRKVPAETSCRDGSCCKSYRLMRRLKEDPELMRRFRRHLSNCRTFALDTIQVPFNPNCSMTPQEWEQENMSKLARGDDTRSQLQQGSQEYRMLQGME